MRNYRRAIDIDPGNLEAFNNLAIAYKNRNEPLKAKSVLNRALALNPRHAGTHYNLAVFYEEAGETSSALHHYRRFLEVEAGKHPSLALEVNGHVTALERQ